MSFRDCGKRRVSLEVGKGKEDKILSAVFNLSIFHLFVLLRLVMLVGVIMLVCSFLGSCTPLSVSLLRLPQSWSPLISFPND